MRTFVKHGVIAVAVAALALACGDNQRQVRNPVSADPQPQSAFNDPAVQPPNDPIANNHHAPRQPLTDPDPQRATLEPPTPQAPISDPQPQKPFYGPGTSPPDNQVLAKTEKPLSDAEVIGVTAAANDGEVQMAELAIKKATSPEVKQFAGMMKSHHQTALQKGKKLQSKTKLEAVDSDASSYLKADAEKALKDLRDKDGKAFDRAYMESQVKAHKDVLTVIDNRLIPSSNNGEVKSMLVEMRRTVADHLVKAEDIQKKMDPTATSSRDTSGDRPVGIGMPEPKEKSDAPAGKLENQSKARTTDGEPKPIDKR